MYPLPMCTSKECQAVVLMAVLEFYDGESLPKSISANKKILRESIGKTESMLLKVKVTGTINVK